MKAIVYIYIYLCYLVKRVFKKNFPGLGKIQKLLKNDHVFTFMGKKLYYKSGIAGAYDYLLIGKSNEPETHHFFKRIVPLLDTANFVDVGASIGEMVTGISIYPHINRIIAFEPRKECVEVLQKLSSLNNRLIEIHANIVSDSENEIPFFYNQGGNNFSGIYKEKAALYVNIKSVKLDSVLPEYMENTILLIDVEGAEPLVLKGGMNFIQKNKPLIIFEYNHYSKTHYCLDDIHSLLGNEYDIFRLRSDGSLDKDFSNSWNCVAIPLRSLFHRKIMLQPFQIIR